VKLANGSAYLERSSSRYLECGNAYLECGNAYLECGNAYLDLGMVSPRAAVQEGRMMVTTLTRFWRPFCPSATLGRPDGIEDLEAGALCHRRPLVHS
jgi:hypothetical protein